MQPICSKLLKTNIGKMSAFRLSTILMKRNELNHSFQDVNEKKYSYAMIGVALSYMEGKEGYDAIGNRTRNETAKMAESPGLCDDGGISRFHEFGVADLML